MPEENVPEVAAIGKQFPFVKVALWAGLLGIGALLLMAVWQGPEKVSSVVEAFGKLALEIGPLIAALVTIYNAVMLSKVHKLTNSSYTEAKGLRDAASAALDEQKQVNADLRVQVAELAAAAAAAAAAASTKPQ